VRRARSKKRGCHNSPSLPRRRFIPVIELCFTHLITCEIVFRVPRRGDAMPVVGEKNPGGQIKRVQCAGTDESAGEQPEVSLYQPLHAEGASAR